MNKKLLALLKKERESYIFDLIMDGYSLVFGDYTISASNGEIANKDLIVSDYFTKRGFNTIKGAIRYIENN